MENPFSRFDDRRRQRDAERMKLNKRLSELNAEGEKDAIAIAMLKEIYPNGFPVGQEADRIDRLGADAVESPPAPTASAIQARGGDLTVKDMALAVLREASPIGLTAAQIKGKAFLRYKKHLNPNTLTVSLVRLKPKVKCEDRTWFYVRADSDAKEGGATKAVAQNVHSMNLLDFKEKPGANRADNDGLN